MQKMAEDQGFLISPTHQREIGAPTGGAFRQLLGPKCNDCSKPFTVTVGTIMEDSKIPLNKWLMAFALYSGGKKGFSAHQLHRALGITYKSA